MNNEARKMLDEMLEWEEDVKDSYGQIKKAGVETTDNTDVIESIFQFLEDIRETQSREMYPAFKTNVQTEIKGLHNALSALKNMEFNFETRDEVKRQWQNRIDTLRNTFQDLFETYADYINYLKLRDMHDEELYESLVTQQEKMDRVVEEIDDLQKSARTALEEIGVAKFTEVYEEKAWNHSLFSALWLSFTIVMGLATTGAVLLLFFWNPFEGSVLDLSLNAQNIVVRLLLVSLPGMGLFWFARNYRSHRHLQEVNEHTKNALMTVRDFVESTDDEDSKDEVLKTATDAVFSRPDTGYVENGAEEEPETDPLKQGIREMIEESDTA